MGGQQQCTHLQPSSANGANPFLVAFWGSRTCPQPHLFPPPCSRGRNGPGHQLQEQPLPGRGQSLQPERQLQAPALGLHLHLQQGDLAHRALQPAEMPQSPAPVLRPRAQRVHLPPPLLLLQGPGLRRAPAANHRPLLLLRGQAQAQLPGAAQRVPGRPPLPVRAPRRLSARCFWGGFGTGPLGASLSCCSAPFLCLWVALRVLRPPGCVCEHTLLFFRGVKWGGLRVSGCSWRGSCAGRGP